MTTANHPENPKSHGLPDLGQMWISPLESEACVSRETTKGSEMNKLDIKTVRKDIWDTKRGERIAVTFYGPKDNANPDDHAQVSISANGWNVCLYMTASELRHMAADLCAAACAIDDASAKFDSFKRFNSRGRS